MADQDLDRLGPLRDRAVEELLTLEENPRRGHSLSGDLKGVRSLVFSEAGVAYRAAYVVRPALRRCVVFMVGPHENFYVEAKRRRKLLKKRGLL